MALGFADEVVDDPLESALLVPSMELSDDQRLFLNAFINTGKIRQAAKISRINAFYHYKWKEEEPTYLNAYTQCLRVIADELAETGRDRAKGYDYEVLDGKGNVRTLRRAGSDVLLMYSLKGLPGGETYRESHRPSDVTINVNNDGHIAFNFDQFRNLLK